MANMTRKTCHLELFNIASLVKSGRVTFTMCHESRIKQRRQMCGAWRCQQCSYVLLLLLLLLGAADDNRPHTWTKWTKFYDVRPSSSADDMALTLSVVERSVTDRSTDRQTNGTACREKSVVDQQTVKLYAGQAKTNVRLYSIASSHEKWSAVERPTTDLLRIISCIWRSQTSVCLVCWLTKLHGTTYISQYWKDEC